MSPDQIKALQVHIEAKPDGFWGPRSIELCKAHLRLLMPHPSPWPSPSSMQAFYGNPGDESRLVNLPAPVPMRYEGKLIKSIRVNGRCAESLHRALIAAYAVAPEFVERYDGCFNDRPMRNGTAKSMHAWGAAIDLDAAYNGNLQSWPVASRMPISVMEAFAREGWIPAGAFWGRDAMHFQATA